MTYEEIVQRLRGIEEEIESSESASLVLDELEILIQDIEDGSELLNNMEFS